MLTVVDPSGLRAGRKSVITAALLIAASLVPNVLLSSVTHVVFFSLVAIGLGWPYLKASIVFARDRNDQTARSLMLSSLLYLPLYMTALVIACWTS
jgi:protoheme IX farnesyltransferase